MVKGIKLHDFFFDDQIKEIYTKIMIGGIHDERRKKRKGLEKLMISLYYTSDAIGFIYFIGLF